MKLHSIDNYSMQLEVTPKNEALVVSYRTKFREQQPHFPFSNWLRHVAYQNLAWCYSVGSEPV